MLCVWLSSRLVSVAFRLPSRFDRGRGAGIPLFCLMLNRAWGAFFYGGECFVFARFVATVVALSYFSIVGNVNEAKKKK